MSDLKSSSNAPIPAATQSGLPANPTPSAAPAAGCPSKRRRKEPDMAHARIYAAINEPSRIFGDRIRKTRLGLGMTQAQLGQKFGISRPAICRIECGHYDITRAYRKYQISNERLRIWSEMYKGGRRKVYQRTPGVDKYSIPRTRGPEPTLPRVSARSRYWESYKQLMKEKGKNNAGKNT